MKIFCYLWLAFLVLCFIFEKVAAWLSNNKRFYKDEIYSYPGNDYESFELNDDDNNEHHSNNNVRKRNERESDFYDIEENVYDSSNDINPTLNLFSWWSSKNKGINRNDNTNKKNNISYKNDDINDNKLKKEFIKNILENSILDDNLSNETLTLKVTNNPIGLSDFLYTTYMPRLNLHLNFIEGSTKQYTFLNNPSATTPIINYVKNPIKNDVDKIVAMNEMISSTKETTENITEIIGSYFNENIIESQLENVTKSDELLLQNDLKRFTSYNSNNAKDVQKEISSTRSYSICTSTAYTRETGSIVYSSLKPTFRTCLPKKEKMYGLSRFNRRKETNNDRLNVSITNKYRLSNYSDQITGHAISSSSARKIYTEQMSATKMLSTKYNSPGLMPPTTSSILKQALMNISRQFNLNKGVALPFPQTADGGILKNSTVSPFSMNPETVITVKIPTIPMTAATLVTAKDLKKSTTEVDPFSFLKPIPTLKTDIVQKTMKKNRETEGQYLDTSNGNKNKKMNASKSLRFLKIKNKPNSDVSNGTEPKFVLPEYLSGLYRSDENNNRKKRTPKNIVTNNDLIKIIKNNFPTNTVDIRKLIGRQCPNSGETSEDFLSKFKNLQNDLIDLQKALVTQAKDLSTADDYKPMIDDKNMSVHVRVIVDVLNGTDENHLNSARESSLGVNRSIEDLEDLNHTLTKRSWFFVPPSDLQNQPQHLIEKIIQQKVLDELEKSMLKKTNDENFLEENNDDSKVNLNFPSLLLNDDIGTTTPNPIITTDISSYDSQNNLSKQKGSKFVLTKTQLVDPIVKNNIVNPVNKAIYSKYLTGKKYLVIPLSYLEEQNKKSNNNSYNILQPSSVFFKFLGNNGETDKNEPTNFIAKYLNKIRSNKKHKATNKVKQKLDLNNLQNKLKDYNNKDVDLIITGRNGTNDRILGEPELICSRKQKIITPYKDDNLYNLFSNRKSNHSIKLLLNHNELLKDSTNAVSLKLDTDDSNQTRPKIQCIKYPLYKLNNCELLVDNNKNELLKARRESNYRTSKPFLFFTLPNNENIFHTEKPICGETNISYCKLNMSPLLKYQDSNYNYTNNKSKNTKTPNMKTFKVDLNIDEDPFDKLDWSLIQKKHSLNGPRQLYLTSSDTQGAMLFASKVNKKKKRGIQNFKRFKRIPGGNYLRRNEGNLMKIKHKIYGVDKVRVSRRQTVPLVIETVNSLNRKLDKSKYSSYGKKLTWDDSKYESKLTNNMDEDKIQTRMLTSNLIDDLENDDTDSGIAELMNTNQSRYYSLHATQSKVATTENIIKAKLKDFGHKLQDSLHSTTSKTTAKTTSKQSGVKNTTCTTKYEEIFPECEDDVCTGIPPPTLISPVNGTTNVKNATATPSEQEIQDACTECVCGFHIKEKSVCTGKNTKCPGGNHTKVHEHTSVKPKGTQCPGGNHTKVHEHTSVKPRGAHCHHHLKNHTTIDHHKMHEHNKTDSDKNGKKKENIKEKPKLKMSSYQEIFI